MKNKLSLLISYIIFSGCSVIMPKLIPFNHLPQPNGEYSVGTQIFNWTDSTRDEWFTEDDVNDKRKLVVQICYPTQIHHGKNTHIWIIQVNDWALYLNN